jgi:hypothetical protein
LYDLFSVNSNIARSEPFTFFTEDGLDVKGERDNNGNEYFIQFDVRGCSQGRKVATGELLAMVCFLITDLVRSLDRAGIGALDFVRKRRPALF